MRLEMVMLPGLLLALSANSVPAQTTGTLHTANPFLATSAFPISHIDSMRDRNGYRLQSIFNKLA